jgi:hypothetical protein
MNRALLICALLTGAFVAVATGSGLYLLGNTESNAKQSPPAGESANADDHVANDGRSTPAVSALETNENQKASETSGDVAKRKADNDSKPEETPKPAAAPNQGGAAKGATERRQLLEVLGALTASHCYQTYLNIGFIADGKANGTYTEKDAYKLLDSVLALVSSVDRKLAALDRIDLDKEDRASLEQMRTLSILLRKQAKDLQTFWDTGKEEDAARYESVRKDSWAALSRLTGVGR